MSSMSIGFASATDGLPLIGFPRHSEQGDATSSTTASDHTEQGDLSAPPPHNEQGDITSQGTDTVEIGFPPASPPGPWGAGPQAKAMSMAVRRMAISGAARSAAQAIG